MVKTLADVAAAPMLGKLAAASNINEAQTGIQGGYGLIGIMGAKNLAAGKSALFGNPLQGPGADAGYSSVGGNNSWLGNLLGLGGSGLGKGTSGYIPSTTTGRPEPVPVAAQWVQAARRSAPVLAAWSTCTSPTCPEVESRYPEPVAHQVPLVGLARWVTRMTRTTTVPAAVAAAAYPRHPERQAPAAAVAAQLPHPHLAAESLSGLGRPPSGRPTWTAPRLVWTLPVTPPVTTFPPAAARLERQLRHPHHPQRVDPAGVVADRQCRFWHQYPVMVPQLMFRKYR
jgi:hypothetical protein